MTPLPGFWMYESSGALAPAVIAYLKHDAMTRFQIAAMRAYFRQWIAGDWKGGEALEALRRRVDEIETQADVTAWLDAAAELEIDPL